MLTIPQGEVGGVVRAVLRDQAGGAVSHADASVRELLVRPPRGPVRAWPAVGVGAPADGVIAHTLVAGDLDMPGRWLVQAHVEVPGESLRSLAIGLHVPAVPELAVSGANLITHAGDNWVTHAGDNLTAH